MAGIELPYLLCVHLDGLPTYLTYSLVVPNYFFFTLKTRQDYEYLSGGLD